MAAENKPNEEVMARIAKLLNMTKADAGTTEGEVENAMRAARRLMDQYNLSMQEVEAAMGDDQPSTAGVDQHPGIKLRQWPKWMEYLAIAVATLTDTRHYYSHRTKWTEHGNRTQETTVVFIGYATDCAVANAMLPYLITTARTMARARYGTGWLTPQRTYALGFAERMIERAREMKDAAGTGTDNPEACKAIVLSKEQNIQQYMEENLNLRKRRSQRRQISDPNAYFKGRSDADRVNIGTENMLS